MLNHIHNLMHTLLCGLLNLSGHTVTLQTRLVRQHSRRLRSSHTEQQEVHGSEEQVSGLDDEAPTCPDGAGSHQGHVLGEGELRGWAQEVGGTG